MGCGSSKSTEVVEVNHKNHSHTQDTRRMKTHSISSSSGVSSYRHPESLRQSDRPNSHDTRDLNQNKEEQEAQVKQQDSHQGSQEQLTAERQKREAEDEEQRRLQERARIEEEKQRQEEEAQAAEARRQNGVILFQQQQTQVSGQNAASGQEQRNGSKAFSHQEIAQHNAEVGWIEWIPHKGKVYDGNGVKAHFPGYMQNREAMLEARARQRVAEGGEEGETEFITFITPFIWDHFPPLSDPDVWRHNGVWILRIRGISEEELAKELPPFLLGPISSTSSSEYFDSIRRDVSMLLEDLRAQTDDTQPSGLQEYVELLSRWQDKFKEADPSDQSPTDATDPNEKSFPLPAVDPESLRLYLLEGEGLDFEIPPEGAWQTYETEKIDFGDPHEIFSSSLRDGYATEELLFDVEGEAAWEVLLDNAIKEELMTPEQQEIQAARNKRTDLNDPKRMRKRREQLCNYFIETRELAPAFVMPFLQWASLLEASQAELDKLCQEEGSSQ